MYKQSVSDIEPTILRVHFSDTPPSGADILMEFKDPCGKFAVSERIAFEELPPKDAGPAPVDEFYFLFIPGGSATAIEMQNHAAVWMSKPDDPEAEPTIELLIKGDKVLWRPGRGMMQGAADRMPDALAGLVSFAFYESELRKIERETASGWDTAEKDVELTHAVGPKDIHQREHVNEMTKLVTLRRMRLARLTPCLESPPAALSGPAKRIFSELASQMEIEDRLEYAGDRLEVVYDMYELCNDRLTEFRYFHIEKNIELWVIVLLTMEVLLMFWEVFIFYYKK